MKLRRAMAAAAATAVIAPLALLSAPAAFATGSEETPSTSTSTSVEDEDLPTEGENPPAEDENPPADGENPPAEGENPPAEDENPPAEDENPPADGENPPAEDENPPADGENPPAEDENPPAEGENPPAEGENPPAEDENPPAEGEDDVELCLDEEGNSTAELSADLRSGLSGLPETIVAGSGWTAFSFNVSNRSDDEIKDIKPLIGVAALGWDEEDYSGQITVQVFDKATGTWNTLADAAGEGGTFAAFSLGAGQSVSYQLRLSVSGKVPDALGLTGGFAEYADDEGCWIADDSNGWIYFFDILAAGSDPGEPNDAKPQTGGKVELDEVKDVKVTGSLAETGSNSALPMIGLAGGVAVVAGAGAVFVVRRRKAGSEA
ncbi:LAETG motif-containing sortase-dependent surface protein [Streptomyces sp. NPDC012403]|uniref:LAETG motif-containing sortase-dependent surface protein n=1 Tax=Streptomyces sp. NPDC012403 TaxID=3364831 RepID=UPI0036EB9E45